jgi:pentatricopeptide repeat protein
VSWFYCITRKVGEGREAVARVDRIAGEEGLPYVRKFAAIIGAWIELYSHNLDAAQEWLDRLAQVMNPSHLYDVATFHGTRGFLYALRGQADLSYADGLKAVEIFDEAGSTMHQMTYRINLVLPLVQKGSFREAREVIAEMHRIGSGSSTHWWKSALLAVEAYTGFEEGDRNGALGTIRTAFEYGRTHGEDYGFANWLQHLMPRLCEEALAADIEVEYVKDLIRRYRWRPVSQASDNWPWPVKIQTLGKFEIQVDDRPVRFSGKVPKKPLLMLKALIAFGGAGVADHRLIDALWPDDEGGAARDSFSMAIHRLRKLLSNGEAVTLRDGRVSLNSGICRVDGYAFEQVCDQAERKALEGLHAEFAALAERGMAMYLGGFLSADTDLPWASGMRERLRAKFVRLVGLYGKVLEAAGQWDGAAAVYMRGLDADELAESFYQGLMRCHQRLGRSAEALSVYRRMRQTFSVILGIKPSAETEALVRLLSTQ